MSEKNVTKVLIKGKFCLSPDPSCRGVSLRWKFLCEINSSESEEIWFHDILPALYI